MNVAYINPFLNSVLHVFKEMVHVACVVGRPYVKREGLRFDRLYSHAATIQLSGSVQGMISLDFAQPVALALASNFAGEEFTQVDENCADALSEMVNIVAGYAKKDIAKGQVSLSIAQVVRTTHMTYPSGASTIVIPFDTDKGRMVMEVAVIREVEPEQKDSVLDDSFFEKMSRLQSSLSRSPHAA